MLKNGFRKSYQMNKLLVLCAVFLSLSCAEKKESITPTVTGITESIYAAGIIKSDNQYSVYPKVNGIVDNVYVESGDYVIKGSPILSIYNETQRLNNENAQLTADFYNFNTNVNRLKDLKNQIEISQKKMVADSIQFKRQKKLLEGDAGTQVDFEMSELNYQTSQTNYQSAINQYNDYYRQLKFNSSQAKKNLQISGATEKDFTVYSEIDGKVYSINKLKGEMISVQTELAIIGDDKKFILEMQVDEKDILKIQMGQQVIVSLDSYGDSTFMAEITKINPIMDVRSKTFLLEAEFIEQPEVLYPNMNFEANILLSSKDEALVIPRKYLVNEEFVINVEGDTIPVVTGLMNYQQVEIISGLTATDKIILPE